MSYLSKPIFYGLIEDGLPLELASYLEITSPLRFWIQYFHQSVFVATVLFVVVACDTLFSGLLIQVCAQAEHLKHRLADVSNIKNDTDQFYSLKRFVQQHVRVQMLE